LISVKLPTRKFLLRFIIASLSVTAALGIVSVLRGGFGETGAKILGTVAGADAASILALCCTGPAKSGSHRAVQLGGIGSAGLGLAGGVYLIWSDAAFSGIQEGILRATVVLVIAAAASAHICLLLPSRSFGRQVRAVVTGTVVCTSVAAELAANYALYPYFDPGDAYLRVLLVLLILDALGTIVILLMRRLGRPQAGAPPDPRRTAPATAGDNNAGPAGALG